MARIEPSSIMKYSPTTCLIFLAALACAASADSSETESGYPWVHHRLFGNERISNGVNARENAHPYQISLSTKVIGSKTSHSCGGSLISEGWVITAAHCLSGISKNGIIIYAGKYNIKSREPNEQSSGVSDIFIHPSYAGGIAPHDIALIKLENPFKFTKAVAAISLPSQGKIHTGNGVLSGWGSTANTPWPSNPKILQTATVPIIETSLCYDALASISANPPLNASNLDNVCSGPLGDSRISVCSGDSGGPLAQTVNEKWELVGVVSWGVSPCGRRGAPSVYARVSAYADWIEGIVANNS